MFENLKQEMESELDQRLATSLTVTYSENYILFNHLSQTVIHFSPKWSPCFHP